MRVIDVRNVHQALPIGVSLLAEEGITEETRNGAARVLPGPCTTLYRCPTERVVFWPERDANPFLHFFEGLWMLAGRNDVAFPAQFAKNMLNYSDDGETLHGAYGHRWRSGAQDQLKTVAELLRNVPSTRRAVVEMWRAETDLYSEETWHRDVPCNTQVYFWRSDVNGVNRLHMTVTCRSNDIVWGAYGANAVHFSMLQEYMAAMIGVPVGHYWQVSNNYHAYLGVIEKVLNMRRTRNPYAQGLVTPYPMVSIPELWDADLAAFFRGEAGQANEFFTRVAWPLLYAHRTYKESGVAAALEHVKECDATDWRLAAAEWLHRRQKNG